MKTSARSSHAMQQLQKGRPRPVCCTCMFSRYLMGSYIWIPFLQAAGRTSLAWPYRSRMQTLYNNSCTFNLLILCKFLCFTFMCVSGLHSQTPLGRCLARGLLLVSGPEGQSLTWCALRVRLVWQAPCAWFGLRVDLISKLPIYAVSNDATQGKSDVTDCSDETVALKF